MQQYTARASGYIMEASCFIAVGRLGAAVYAAGGIVPPSADNAPFAYRSAGGPVLWSAVVTLKAPADFKAPDGWKLYRS